MIPAQKGNPNFTPLINTQQAQNKTVRHKPKASQNRNIGWNKEKQQGSQATKETKGMGLDLASPVPNGTSVPRHDHNPNQEINHTTGKSRHESLKEAQHIVNQADRTTN
jgi:hypothetical protein